MSDYGARRACLLRAYEPSLRREVQLGKIVPVQFRTGDGDKWCSIWCYVNNLSAKLNLAESFGVARPVVKLMQDWDVERVLYFYGSLAYRIALEKVTALSPWTPGHKPPYFQVPITAWTLTPETWIVHVPRTDDVLTLRWDEADAAYAPEQAQQLGMAL